jgi:3-oxoacyl-[acyl-carrier protein] reductase
MDLGISGKRALVLASSQGLGLGVATKLCEEGAHVLICGRVADKLAAVTADLNAAGPGKADYSVADLSDAHAAGELYKAAKEKLGGVDILVNNTGGPPPGTVEQPDTELWKSQIDTMLLRVIEIPAGAGCLPSRLQVLSSQFPISQCPTRFVRHSSAGASHSLTKRQLWELQ